MREHTLWPAEVCPTYNLYAVFLWLLLSGGTYRIPWDLSLTQKANLAEPVYCTPAMYFCPFSRLGKQPTCFILFWSSGHQYESSLNRINSYNLRPLTLPTTKIKDCYLFSRSHFQKLYVRGSPFWNRLSDK